MYHVNAEGAVASGYVCGRRETFSRTVAVPDSHFLAADIKMDGFNMRRADGTATIAFETAGVMQDCEARWSSVTMRGGGKARATKATFDDV